MSVETRRAPQPLSFGQTALNLGLGVAVPIAYCTLLLYTKIAALLDLLRLHENNNLRSFLEIGHMLLSIAFVALLGVLFVTRKKVIGPQSTFVGAIVAVLGSMFPFFLALGETTQLSDGLLFVSFAILIVGEVLMVWSLASLGRCFGVFPVARGLVTHGPYARIRHPLYTAEAIVTFGFLLTCLSPLTVAIFVGGMALQAWRTINEERALLYMFPEYAAYRERTGRFLPRWS